MPAFPVAYAHIQRVKLGLGLGLRDRIHPRQRFNSLAECHLDVRHHSLDLRLGFRREVALRVQLPHVVAQKAVDQGHTAFPALPLFRHAREHFSEESKLFIRECLRQCKGVGFNQVVGQPVLPGFERSGGDQSRFSGERRRLPHDKTFLFAESCALKILGPLQAGSFGIEIAQRPGVVGLVNVIVFRQADMFFGNRVLQLDDASGASVGIVESCELQHRGHVRLVLGARLAHCIAIGKVIFAVRQP